VYVCVRLRMRMLVRVRVHVHSVCECTCVCVYAQRMGKSVMLGGVACVSCHVICQVSAGTVSETVLQTRVWVTVMEVTCMEG
jgi:hypothetical protein